MSTYLYEDQHNDGLKKTTLKKTPTPWLSWEIYFTSIAVCNHVESSDLRKLSWLCVAHAVYFLHNIIPKSSVARTNLSYVAFWISKIQKI